MEKFWTRLATQRRELAVLLLIFIGSTLPYWRTLGFDILIEWDDGHYLIGTPHLDLTLKNIIYQFSHTHFGLYTPLPMLSLMIDRAWSGLTPWIFHLHNLILHGVVAILFYGLLRSLKIQLSVAALVALLWALFPGRVESVAWIAERKDLLAGLFFFGSAMLFVRHAERDQISWASAALFLAGTLSKPTTLPLIALLAIYKFLRCRQWRATVRSVLPHLVVAGAICTVYFALMHQAHSRSLHNIATISGMGEAVLRLLRYISSSLLPWGQNPLYPDFAENPATYPMALAGLALIIIGIIGAKKVQISRSQLAGYALAFIALWLPLEHSKTLGAADFADRYTYLLSSVLFLLIAHIAQRVGQLHPGKLRYLLTAGGLTALIYLAVSWCYVPTFANTTKLFKFCLERDDLFNVKAATALAAVGYNKNQPELIAYAGQRLLERAEITSDPEKQEIYYNSGRYYCGTAAWRQRQFPQAAQLLLPPLKKDIQPAMLSPQKELSSWYAMAISLYLQFQQKSAAQLLLNRQLNSQIGTPAELAFARGLNFYLQGNYPAAQQAWEQALQLNPQDRQVQFNLNRLKNKMAE